MPCHFKRGIEGYGDNTGLFNIDRAYICVGFRVEGVHRDGGITGIYGLKRNRVFGFLGLALYKDDTSLYRVIGFVEGFL